MQLAHGFQRLNNLPAKLATKPLVNEIIANLEDNQISVSANQQKYFEQIADLLLNRLNYQKQIAVPAPLGFGKSTLVTAFARYTALGEGAAVTIVMPFIDDVSRVYEAVEEVAPGEALAIRGKSYFEGGDKTHNAGFQKQFEVAQSARILIMTAAMYRRTLDNGSYDNDLSTYRGQFEMRDDVRHVLIDESIDFVRYHSIKKSELQDLLTTVESAVFNDRIATDNAGLAKVSFKAFKDAADGLLDAVDRMDKRICEAITLMPVLPTYRLSPTLLRSVRARLGFDVEAKMRSLEFLVSQGGRVEYGQRRKVDDQYETDLKQDAVFEPHLVAVEPAVASIAKYPTVFLDATCAIDMSYQLIPGISFLLPETPLFTYENLEIVVCGHQTASRNWSINKRNLERLARFIKEDVSKRSEKTLVTTYKGTSLDCLTQLLEDTQGIEVIPNASGRGSNAYADFNMIVHAGTAVPGAVTQITRADRYYDEIDGRFSQDKKLGIRFEDPRVQALQANQIAVLTAQLIGRLRPNRRVDEVVTLHLNLPDESVVLLQDFFPGCKITRRRLLGSNQTNPNLVALESLLESYEGNELTKKSIYTHLRIEPGSWSRFLKRTPEASNLLKANGWVDKRTKYIKQD